MKVPLSWLKEFVEIELPIQELAYRLTIAGLEVEEIRYVGLPMPSDEEQNVTKISGFSWDPEMIVVGEIREVMEHPNADRLVLCRLFDGQVEHTVLTGAPNLFEYKGKGTLEALLKVAYAREGAEIIDAYADHFATTVLKRKKIRGVESYSMACSEKELGISEEHEGIILLDEDAEAGTPLVDYLGDAVFDIAITPNIARAASIYGVAREIAAITGVKLNQPDLTVLTQGPDIQGKAEIEITEPELNPRFVLGLIEGISFRPSPYRYQLRLKLAGMRPIDSVVDATNYTMLELGEPLHAFDYDVLVDRAGGKPPTIITRTAKQGEKLTTLDDVERKLDDFTVLVCDTQGPLSIAGVMGGLESEVTDRTSSVLLEGASWNFINIRQTVGVHKLHSEAAYRFERGVHPALASQGVLRCLELMRRWAGGTVYKGLVDNYPLPPDEIVVEFSSQDVQRWLGIELAEEDITRILESLMFEVEVQDSLFKATVPQNRLDINTGLSGVADIMEEIARVYGYDRIPETRMADELPPQRGNWPLEVEERIRDILVELGLQEIATYRLTSSEREARRLRPGTPSDDKPYITLANPLTNDRNVLRHSLIASVLEIVEINNRIRERIALFEIGPVYLDSEEGPLPEEKPLLVIALTGQRSYPDWQGADTSPMDFYDLKGVVDGLLDGLHLAGIEYQPADYPSFHPGKCARVSIGDVQLGIIGEVHPQVRENFDLPETDLMIARMDVNAIIEAVPGLFTVRTMPSQPPVLEDLAVTVDEDIPAAQVEELISQTGGDMLTDVHLFDVYRGDQIGKGKKSLAYSLTYQALDRTLTDNEVRDIRRKILRRLEREIGAQLRQ